MASIEEIQALIADNNERLQLLKRQEAQQGRNVDPSVVIEIKKIEEEIADLRAQLLQLQAAQQPPAVQPPTHVPFTNREDELNLVLSSFAPAYYLVDAPAGYGKTEFLKELEKRLKERRWRCVYAAVNENESIDTLAKALTQKLELTLSTTSNLPWGAKMGGALWQQWQQIEDKEGLILLIDLDKKPSLDTLSYLLNSFIPDVQDSLRTLAFFANKHNRFRVIIAGRYLAARKEVKDASIPFRSLRLSTFSYDIIRESAVEFLGGHQEESIKQLAAHLLYLTGGHPGCMAHVLEMYAQQGLPPDIFLQTFALTIWREHVSDVVEEIRGGVPNDSRELHKILDAVSLFRCLDYDILRHIITAYNITELDNAYDLADNLTETYILGWKGRFLRDDIARRLLAIRLRHTQPEEFARRSQQARQACLERILAVQVQGPETWAIESLFQALQQHANTVQDTTQRQAIRTQFFDHDLPTTLKTFIDQREVPPKNIQAEKIALKQAMEEDWEFRFTVNYYLRADQYNNEPYETLREKIDTFFEQKQNTGGPYD